MAARLRLISKRIPWFLARRAAVFGLAWLILPFWAFLLVALGLYLIPLFQPHRMWLPCAVTLVFALVLSPSVLGAAFLSALFFLVLGIKDLVFVDRKGAYETLTLLLFFGMFLKFFSATLRLGSPVTLVWMTLLALVFFFVARQAFAYDPLPSRKFAERRATLTLGCAAFVLWELMGVMLFLPLDLFYATALAFLSAAVLAALASELLHDRLTRRGIFAHAVVFGVAAVLILNLVPWEL